MQFRKSAGRAGSRQKQRENGEQSIEGRAAETEQEERHKKKSDWTQGGGHSETERKERKNEKRG